MIVGYGRPSAVISGSVSAALRRASSASSARMSTNRLSSAETPSRRCEAWAARPGHGQPERDRAGVGDDDVEVRRLGDDRQVAGRAGPDRGERPLPAVLLGRHERDEQLARRAGRGRPPRRAPGRAARIAATPPFMSQAPRPYSAPSRISPPHGSTVQVAGSPGGTTSRWPDRMTRRPPGRPEPPDDDRQRRPRHLLARPVRVGADRRRVRVERSRPSSPSVAQRVGRPGRDRLLGPGDARDPDERLEVGDQPVAVDRRAPPAPRSPRSATQDRPGHAGRRRPSR